MMLTQHMVVCEGWMFDMNHIGLVLFGRCGAGCGRVSEK